MLDPTHVGRTFDGHPSARTRRLLESILSTLEDRHGIWNSPPSVPARVQRLRQQIVELARRPRLDKRRKSELNSELADLSFVIQLFSYPGDYLDGHPSIERIAETWDRLEEDVLGVTTAHARGLRKAIVTFGEPIAAQPAGGSACAEAPPSSPVSSAARPATPLAVPSSSTVRVAGPSAGASTSTADGTTCAPRTAASSPSPLASPAAIAPDRSTRWRCPSRCGSTATATSVESRSVRTPGR